MFNIFSRSRSSTPKMDFPAIGTDMHSHLLPGIDDGAPDLATSLQLIRGLRELGYKKLITTPHIFWDMYRNTPAIIQQKLAEVRAAVSSEGIDVELLAAAEYFLDEHMSELLQKKEPLLTISGKLVLTEFSMAFYSMSVKDIIFEMQMQGYQPIIAHPERYTYLQADKQVFTELRDAGCIFQLNLLSLGGHYGRTVTELATYLLKNDYYSLVGTDLHHSNHLDSLRRAEMAAPLRKLIESGSLLNATL